MWFLAQLKIKIKQKEGYDRAGRKTEALKMTNVEDGYC